MRGVIGLLIISCILVGCSKPLTNDEIIAEKNKCLAADMDYDVYLNGFDYKPRFVSCKKRGDGKYGLPVNPEKVEK